MDGRIVWVRADGGAPKVQPAGPASVAQEGGVAWLTQDLVVEVPVTVTLDLGEPAGVVRRNVVARQVVGVRFPLHAAASDMSCQDPAGSTVQKEFTLFFPVDVPLPGKRRYVTPGID
ncbi:MAG TPA: hypothetical protein VNT75_03790 [Symbiobacteriaceae bacterium]|nr:hypothetical protein [Symbiobacteriaceae bacterium]